MPEEKGKGSKLEKKSGKKIEIEYLSDDVKVMEAQVEEIPLKKSEKNKASKAKPTKKDIEINELKKEVEKLKDEYLRVLAEKDNLRKRHEREKKEHSQYALSETLREFLNVLDNFERALGTEVQTDNESLREGIELIYRQFQDILQKLGVRQIEIKENKFDPRLQQAFTTDESDSIDEPEVSQELQKGYMLHDRLLRPALVKVLMPKKEK